MSLLIMYMILFQIKYVIEGIRVRKRIGNLFEDMTLDHVKPLSMGGEDNVSNLSCTCEPCNHFKGNQYIDY